MDGTSEIIMNVSRYQHSRTHSRVQYIFRIYEHQRSLYAGTMKTAAGRGSVAQQLSGERG
jgi:hypothetical protein